MSLSVVSVLVVDSSKTVLLSYRRINDTIVVQLVVVISFMI
jgi:hypothetical protein